MNIKGLFKSDFKLRSTEELLNTTIEDFVVEFLFFDEFNLVVNATDDEEFDFFSKPKDFYNVTGRINYIEPNNFIIELKDSLSGNEFNVSGEIIDSNTIFIQNGFSMSGLYKKVV